MDLSKYILLKVLTVIVVFSQYQSIAQTKAIIIDAETKIPIDKFEKSPVTKLMN